MKIEQLYEFMILAHYLNFTTAAFKLHISQSNLSKHIAEIEKELGVSLFNRGRTLELTAAGSAFHEDVIQIHHSYLDAVKRCRDISANTKEELIIQEPYTMDTLGEVLYKSLRKFKTRNPYILSKFRNDSSKKSIESLEAGKVDIGITIDCSDQKWIQRISDKKGLVFYPIVQEPLYMWMHEGHFLNHKDHVTLEDLLNFPINMTNTRCFDPMRFMILDMFEHSLGVRPDLQARSTETLESFFMNTSDFNAVFLVSPGMITSPILTMQQDMVFKKIDDPRATITSYLVISADYDKASIDKFLDVVDEVVANDIEHKEGSRYLAELQDKEKAPTK